MPATRRKTTLKAADKVKTEEESADAAEEITEDAAVADTDAAEEKVEEEKSNEAEEAKKETSVEIKLEMKDDSDKQEAEKEESTEEGKADSPTKTAGATADETNVVEEDVPEEEMQTEVENGGGVGGEDDTVLVETGEEAGDAATEEEKPMEEEESAEMTEGLDESGDKTAEEKTEDSKDEKKEDTKVKEEKKADDDVIIVEGDDDDEKPIPLPESFSKLHQLTVNIGPIKQRDLMSKELHNILNLTWNFEIKFEKKETVADDGITKSERPGYVRIPFFVKSPRFLVTIAKKLGNLRIDGRDMSVKFPEAFNNAVKDCEVYSFKVNERVARQKVKKLDLMKRQIVVRNVPPKVEEDTIKSIFPEACGVSMNMTTADDGTKTVKSVMLDFETEKASGEFLESNKDVTIGDCKVKLSKVYIETRGKRQAIRAARGAGFRGNRGGRGGSGARGGQFNVPGGQGRGIMGAKPGTPTSSSSAPRGRGQFRNQRGGQSQGQTARSKNFTSPNRPQQSPQNRGRGNNQGRQSLSPHGGGGNQGKWQGQGRFQGNQRSNKPYPADRSLSSQQQRQANQAFTGGRDRMQQQSGNRRSGGGGGDEDPMAMMSYLKNTLARMEEKIAGRSDSDYGYGDGGYMGGGGGGGNRKRKANRNDSDFGNKRQYGQDNRYSDRDTSFNTTSRGYDNMSSNFMDNNNFGNFTGTTYGNTGNTGNQMGSYGNTGMSNYGGGASGYSGNSGNYGGNSGNYGGNSGNSGNYGGNSGNRW